MPPRASVSPVPPTDNAKKVPKSAFQLTRVSMFQTEPVLGGASRTRLLGPHWGVGEDTAEISKATRSGIRDHGEGCRG